MRDVPRVLAAFSIGLVCLAGCARKTYPPAADTTAGPRSETGASATDYRQNKWTYDVMPSPAPSVTPLYRLNEVAFEKNSASLGKEASGVCREVASVVRSSGIKGLFLLGHMRSGETPADLGLKRASKLRDCLVGQGLKADMFELSNFGTRISDAQSTEALRLHAAERVEIWVLSE